MSVQIRLNAAGVYRIRHIPSERCYVGSSLHVGNRLGAHKFKLRTGKHENIALQRAWDKYGSEEFAFEPVLVCESDLRIMYEQIVSDAFRAYAGDGGFNLRRRAESSQGIPSRFMSHKVGDRYNRLVLVEIVSQVGEPVRARFLCDCGGEIVTSAHEVRRGGTKSCGCLNREKIEAKKKPHFPGERHYRMTLLYPIDRGDHRRAIWVFRCDCGVEKTTRLRNVLSGATQSCGCLTKENGAIGRHLYQERLRMKRQLKEPQLCLVL